MSQNAKTIGRRELLRRGATIAAVAAIPAVGLSIATKARGEPGQLAGDDAELRRLWAKYLDQLGSLKGAEAAHSQAREPYEAEYDALKHAYLDDDGPARLGDLHRKLWKKHRLEPTMARLTREHRNLIKLTKAIRKAKAETLFGIGAKLSVSEHFEDYDVVEAAEDARRALGMLAGFDFIAATGPLVSA